MNVREIDTKRLANIQQRLKKRVMLKDSFMPQKIAGVDLAYSEKKACCAAVVIDYQTLEVIEEKVIRTRLPSFPYIPGFLAFREAWPIIKVLKDLEFDIAMLDGQGIAHPRGVGIASHIGVLLDVPTIGVAKNLLCGDVAMPDEINVPRPIILNDRTVGYAVKTKTNTRPIFISPGHKVSVKSALEIAMHCVRGYRLPEPCRLAHTTASRTCSK